MIDLDFVSLFTIALLGGFGHCIGMCGGIVIAYSGAKIDDTTGKFRQIPAHLAYGFGRVSTYALIGTLFGALGSALAFTNTARGVLLMLAGLGMVAAGFSLAGKFSFLQKLEHSLSHTRWYRTWITELIHGKSMGSFFALGMANGLLPCGFVYFFAISAAATAHPIWGALVMVTFGVATIPPLLLLGTFVGLVKQTHFRTWMMRVAMILVIIYGIFTISKGYQFLVGGHQPQRGVAHESCN